MKQKLSLSLLAFAFGILPALANEPARVYLNAGNVEHVKILSNMEIILLQAPADGHSIVLDQNAFGKLNIHLSNKTLYISERKSDPKSKTIVYLYVSNLKSITVEGESEIKTVGVLETDRLDIFVDDNAKAHIKATGNIKAHSLNDSKLDIKYLSKNTELKRGY